MTRGVDPATGRIGMHYADLENIPKDLRWVPTEPEMVSGRGTPLETYMTMRQMRILEGKIGRSLEITAPRVFEMTTILNERTIAQLAKAAPGVEPPSNLLNQAVLSTDSVTYAKNTITQSGGRIAGARVEGGTMVPASEAGFRGISPGGNGGEPIVSELDGPERIRYHSRRGARRHARDTAPATDAHSATTGARATR